MKNSRKASDDGNLVVASILFLYIGLILLGGIYGVHCDSLNTQPEKTTKKPTEAATDAEEFFGTIVAVAKEMDGHCEYRACDKTNKTCDWYDNSNSECDGMNKGDWIVKVENKIYKGTSLCSKTAGKFAKSGTPSQTNGAYCWCKSGSDWVHHLFLNSASYCSNNGCAGNCAHAFLYSPKFRSALLKAKVQEKRQNVK